MESIIEGEFHKVSNKINNRFLTILKVTNVSRDLVLFTMFGLSSTVFFPELTFSNFLFMLLIVDFLGLLILLLPKEELMPLGCAWAGVMSIVLMFYTNQFLGHSYLSSDAVVVFFLSIIQLLALLKIGLDSFASANQESEAA